MALIDLTLIPFGLRLEDDSFVDVSHIEKGRKCGCICPSCKTPLIARQGEIKQWHFAHASRSVYEQTNKECDYSFFVSVRLMARQVIGNALEIKLPRYEETVYLFVEKTDDYLSEKFIVTSEQRVQIESIEIEKEIFGVTVDVYGKIDGYPIVLYFTHPNRSIPHELRALESEKCGIVEVSLSETYSLFTGARDTKQSYLGKLRLFLAEDTPSKHWIFHPRYRPMRDRANQVLAERREALLQHLNEEMIPVPDDDRDSLSGSGNKPRSEVIRRKVKYQCLICGSTWFGFEPGYSPCPKCETHLFGKRVGYID